MSRESNDLLLLFSSNAQELYKIDILNVLASPNRWMQHFRYDTKYVDEKVWKYHGKKRTQKQLDRYIGNEVLVIFNNQTRENNEFHVIAACPVRYGKIVALRLVAGVLHVWFALDLYFFYGREDPVRQAQEISERILTTLGQNGPKGQKHAILTDMPSLSRSDKPNEEEAFAALVEVLTNHGFPANKTLFTRVAEFSETWRERAIDGPLKHKVTALEISPGPAVGLSGYEFTDTATYSLYLTSLNTVVPGTENGGTSVSIGVNKDYLEVIGPEEVPVIGRYDQYQFVIKPKRQARDQWTTMRVSCGQGGIVGLRWDVPVLVKADRVRETVQLLSEVAVGSGVVIAAINQLLPQATNELKWLSLSLVASGFILIFLKFVVNRR